MNEETDGQHSFYRIAKILSNVFNIPIDDEKIERATVLIQDAFIRDSCEIQDCCNRAEYAGWITSDTGYARKWNVCEEHTKLLDARKNGKTLEECLTD